MLAVDREQPAARTVAGSEHQVSPRNEALLVGQRDVGAVLERGQGRLESGGAHHPVQDDVGAALANQLCGRPGAFEHLTVEIRSRPRSCAGLGERNHRDVMRTCGCHQFVGARVRRQGTDP